MFRKNMKIHTYIINLQHATKRWEYMRSQLIAQNLPHTRVEAIHGEHLSQPIKEYDRLKHHRLTGKQTNLREIGCYLSHLKALRQFLQTDDSYALVLEDDAILPLNITEIIHSADQFSKHWDVLRLSSSRDGKYLVFGNLDTGHRIAFNTKVLKSAAAYLINQKAARLCLEKMLPLYLPYDVALDRDWDFGFRTACVTPFPVKVEREMESQIPIAKRIPLYRATTFHFFHLMTRLQRINHRKRYYSEAIQEMRSSL